MNTKTLDQSEYATLYLSKFDLKTFKQISFKRNYEVTTDVKFIRTSNVDSIDLTTWIECSINEIDCPLVSIESDWTGLVQAFYGY